MSNAKKLRKAYSKELALELRGKKRKRQENREEMIELAKENEARNSKTGGAT